MKVLTNFEVGEKLRGAVQAIRADVEIQEVKAFADPDPDAEAIVTFVYKFSRETLDQYPNLRWIHSMTAGVDTLPLAELAARRIILTNARGCHQIQMTEHVLWSVLTLFRQGHYYVRQQSQRIWQPELPIEEMHGKTVCIVGAGTIGEAVAAKCRVFGMTVLGISLSGKPNPVYHEVGSLNRLSDFLGLSDVVIAILPLTPETINFFNAERFAQMRQGAYFVNVARGQVVDEEALAAALRSGHLRGAALDVFGEEPLPATSPFWEMENVLLTPHIAGRSPHYFARAFGVFVENLRCYPDVARMGNVVDLSRGY